MLKFSMLPTPNTLPRGLVRLAAGLGVLSLAALLIVPQIVIPIEDAIILHIFSRNWAETGVISYISGGPRAEGATDFLWMAYIALGMKLHLGPAVFSAIANIASAIGLGWIALRLAGERPTPFNILAFLGVLAFFPQIESALDGFCVLPFVFGLALLIYFVIRCPERDAAAPIAALFLCLIRPDGIVFALPLLLWALISSFSTRKLVMNFLLFVLPGAIYFLWRWHYFGRLFPLPFLVKSDTHHFGLSLHSLSFLAFAVTLIIMADGKRLFARRELGFLTASLVVPTLFYARMRLDQNVGERFFFYLPVIAFVVIAMQWNELFTGKRAIVWAAIGMWVVLIAPLTIPGVVHITGDQEKFANRRDVALGLAQIEPHGTLMATEAGLFPYYSRWPGYDPWGLNTAQFAEKFIQPQSVVQLRPDLIVMQTESALPESCRATKQEARSERDWNNMIQNVQTATVQIGDYTTWVLPDVRNSIVSRFQPTTRLFVTCWYISKRYAEADAVAAVLHAHHGFQLSDAAPVAAGQSSGFHHKKNPNSSGRDS